MELDLEKYIGSHSPGYMIGVYHDGKYEEVAIGNRATRPKVEACHTDTLYDIASLTKVYTATLVYIAYEEGRVDIYSRVKDVDERFAELGDVTILDLLSHNQEVWTDGYLGDAKNREEFYKILFSARVKSEIPTYIDAHYMIVSTILEKVYDKSFRKILEEKIFRKLGLKRTTVEPEGDNIASNNYESTDGKTDGKTACETQLGMVHDAKARTGKALRITTGHAAIFTTAKELGKFLRSFLDGRLLRRETVKLMLECRDGNTYNNMGTRYQRISTRCSKKVIEFSGYTGPAFLVDFEREIIVVVMCNVLHNTKLERAERRRITNEIVGEVYGEVVGRGIMMNLSFNTQLVEKIS